MDFMADNQIGFCKDIKNFARFIFMSLENN